MPRVKLGVNIDHVATLRQARRGTFPSVLDAARLVVAAGADGVTVHLREDRRHIQDRDVGELRAKVRTRLNLEMACTAEMTRIACRLRPDEVCLVPEHRRELTTEGGLDALRGGERIRRAAERLRRAGIQVNVFVDPDPRQVRAAKAAGADGIELHTGSYALARTRLHRGLEFRKLVEAARTALDSGLILNAGHGLDYSNAGPVAGIFGMNALNIGFSIVARALFTGLDQAVREMKSIIRRRRSWRSWTS
ncbi:MAG: pyridoxine 5'-phosphate synthase [Elusimicrobia bacterium RIFCSPHIGHO2_01_FULL_64_10]|nr:MAG: pyridoxine 5'-phosphate synthase [Elusimicrobia bacterium RIFCSPHIGHO2_01_FULL_64_10]